MNDFPAMAETNTSIGIAGTGRVARALGRLLVQRGEAVVLAGRNPARTEEAAAFIGSPLRCTLISSLGREAGPILIAVSDRAVEEVARILAQSGPIPGPVLHTAGCHGPEILAPLLRQGVFCGLLHPLQTLATAEQGVRVLSGSFFAVCAEGAALDWAERIVKRLGGRPLRIPPETPPLYHAAAVLASNYVVSLLDASLALLKQCGIPEQDARRALTPLVTASLDNALREGPVQALTGPVERGDVLTIRRHLESLGRVSGAGDLAGLYRGAGRWAVRLARRKGLDQATAAELEDLLD